MSLCINNDLIWVSVPRCASVSIEKTLASSELEINFYKKKIFFDKNIHVHVQLETLHKYFGLKESICITRNTIQRFISGLEHWWWQMEMFGLNPIIPFSEIDNNFIYKHFTDEIINNIYTYEPFYTDIDFEYITNRQYLNDYFSITKGKKIDTFLPLLIISQLFWTNNNKCTYQFDFNNISLFEEYISDRYKINFKLQHLNSRNKSVTKIKVDEKFENWVYDKFEKRFTNSEIKLI